ncbi:glycoside hydrolase family 9 protein [Pedobacter paludis]|uniref:Glycosyl transferase n=1 Tax=Pedobacter paludis TaxID=2203212 RepID=A0A317F6S5_9SPHI|nr:glycoside hydrolase family 9 protein [Pedobacter paludis]PWS33747.1 glycosyl transferase [Pedobacter paludis]
MFSQPKRLCSLCILFLLCALSGFAEPIIYVNQIAYDSKGSKIAVIGVDERLSGKTTFSIVDVKTKKTILKTSITGPFKINEWNVAKIFYRADFSMLTQSGHYKLQIMINSREYSSSEFEIGDKALAKITIPAILHYYRKQRANTEIELSADKQIKLFGSDETVDLRGGWCDASGDVSKYFSHLACANFVSPQQIPLVTWSLINTAERVPNLIKELKLQDSIADEALWGADYLMRSLSKNDYFYMIVFSYFTKDPKARRVVGLHANSVTTNEYQSAFREGAGMAIASLARISKWGRSGDFTSKQYLEGAKRAFAHLLINNNKYTDDGKDNIIDDYCALMASTELWYVTREDLYRKEARKRVLSLRKRITDQGYFIADDGDRPFWHAADAGLPVLALTRYLDLEQDPVFRKTALAVVKKNIDYNISITNEVENPFGYARQSFRFNNAIKKGFFIPHENETGWWWQGENARLASLATAALIGGRLTEPSKTGWKTTKANSDFVAQQISWILGANPYLTCFMYGFGQNNVPYMHSNYGHGSERGGISNGITGKDGSPDGSGIDFKREAEGNEWRWTEQWLPHAAWFLQAVTAMVKEN